MPCGSARCSSKYVSPKGLYLSATGRRRMSPSPPSRGRRRRANAQPTATVRAGSASLYKNGQLCTTFSAVRSKSAEAGRFRFGALSGFLGFPAGWQLKTASRRAAETRRREKTRLHPHAALKLGEAVVDVGGRGA